MSSIPLPALAVKTPQQPDLLQQYGNLLALRNMQQQSQIQQQEAPYRMQALKQNAEAGKIALEEHQQQLAQQKAFGTYMSDPSVANKTLGGAADALARQGIISPQTYTTWKKADLDQRSTLATTTDTELKNMLAAHTATQQLYNNVMNLPEDQFALNWPSIAQQYDAIPGNNKKPLDPNHPMTKEQLKQFGPLISMQESYLNSEIEKRKAATAQQTAEADLEQKKQNLQFGPSGPAADSKYRFLQTKLASKQPISSADQAWMKGYEKQKLLVPATTANIRVEGYGQTKEYPVFDHKTGLTVMVTPTEINRASDAEPGRYSPASYTPESIGAKDATNYFINGKGGQQLTAFNTAISHLQTFKELAKDLNNGDIRIVNAAKQRWAEETGNPAPVNYAAAVNALSGEVAAALKTSGATDQEIDKASSSFSRAQSLPQALGVADTYMTLLQGKNKNLKKQYDAGMQGKPAFDNGSSSGGVSVTTPNGKVYLFKDQQSADAFKQKAGIQ
jgi:hypothetical protein